MTSYDYPHQNLSNNPSSSLYCQYLQTQHQWISSIFATATSTLETNIMSNILKILEEDKTKSQNIMMITLCQLAQKIHCNGALLENVLSKNDDEKYQHNLQHTLTLIKNQQNNKFQAIENELIVIKKNIKSNENMLNHVSHQLDILIKQSNTLKPNDPNPNHIKKLMDKFDKMDKKINLMKSKQIKSLKDHEQHTNIAKQISIDNNEIKKCILNQSTAIQSVKRKLETTFSQQMTSLSKKVSSIQTQMTESRAAHQQISSLNTKISSIKTQLSSIMNTKFNQLADSVSKNTFSESKSDIRSGTHTNNKSNRSMKNAHNVNPSHFDDKSITNIEAETFKKNGNELYKKKKFKNAITEYKKCQKLCPSDPTYIMNESAALLMMNKLNECEQCCLKVIAMDCEQKWLIKAYKRLGIIKEKQDNMIRAMEYYCKVLKLKPDDDIRTKVRKWVNKNKDNSTEAERNIINNRNWKCLHCKSMNDPDNVNCIACGCHADITKDQLDLAAKEGML
eukprot:141872_1